MLGDKMRGKNLRIYITYLSGLTIVIIRTLRVCEFLKFPFRVFSVLQMLGGKIRVENLSL